MRFVREENNIKVYKEDILLCTITITPSGGLIYIWESVLTTEKDVKEIINRKKLISPNN